MCWGELRFVRSLANMVATTESASSARIPLCQTNIVEWQLEQCFMNISSPRANGLTPSPEVPFGNPERNSLFAETASLIIVGTGGLFFWPLFFGRSPIRIRQKITVVSFSDFIGGGPSHELKTRLAEYLCVDKCLNCNVPVRMNYTSIAPPLSRNLRGSG